MKRIIAIVVIICLALCLMSCKSNTRKSSSRNNDNGKKEGTTITTSKTAIEKLKEYILQNGGNYQGTYMVIHWEESNCTIISCSLENKISFYYSTEGEHNESSVELELYEGSVTQSLKFTYEQNGCSLTANGTLGTTFTSYEDCSVVGITYRENFPSSVSKSTLERIVNEMFPLATKAMLASVNAMLVKNIGIQLKDLGFTNW